MYTCAGVCAKQRHWTNVLSSSGTYESHIKFHLEVNSHFLFITKFQKFLTVLTPQKQVIEKTLE